MEKQIKLLLGLGYRVVPEYVATLKKFEIIIEHWDVRLNTKRPGKTKRTGIFFTQTEINKRGAKDPYYEKMEEIRLKLIEHCSKKRELVNQ